MNYHYEVVFLGGMSAQDVAKLLNRLGADSWQLKQLTPSGYAIFEKATQESGLNKDNDVVAGQAAFFPVFPAGQATPPSAPTFEGKTESFPPLNFWELKPNTRAGEKRLEVRTAMAKGTDSKEHSHRAVLVLDAERNVKSGLTDFHSGHVHTIKRIGRTEEVDGHSHLFQLTEEGAVGVSQY